MNYTELEGASMKRQLMGYGLTADVYQWAGHTVLKLFKDNIQDQVIEYEALIHEMVYDKGIRMPKLIEEIQYEGRRGFIYERCNGRTLLFQMMKKKWKVRHFAKVLARAQVEIQRNEAPLLPNLKDRLQRDIHSIKSLAVEDAERLMAYIDILPEGDSICHMDFHPGNVFYDQGITHTIDWVTASRSVPAADIARTYVLVKHSDSIIEGPSWVRALESFWRWLFLRSYLKTIKRETGITFEDVEIWLKPIAIARMSEGISEKEKEVLFDTYM